MGNQPPVHAMFLSEEGKPNAFGEFHDNFNLEVEGRSWQWKITPSVCGFKGTGGMTKQCHSDKKKKPKLVSLVKEKCKALIFQLSDPSRVPAVNYELELPYKTNIPVVIFCGGCKGAAAPEIEAAVKGKLSRTLRTKRVRILPHDGHNIPTGMRNAAMDWLALTLELPVMEGGEEYPEETLSLVVVGSAHVGKTSLLQRYVNDEFNPRQGPTMGIDKFTVKRQFRLPGRARDQQFILDIWDTAGEARYRTVTLAFYNSAHGFAVVFDVTQRESFDDVSHLWFDNIVQAKNTTPFGVVLVACKCDTPLELWEIPRQEILDFVEENELAFVETSAKAPAAQINEVFSQLVIRTATALSD